MWLQPLLMQVTALKTVFYSDNFFKCGILDKAYKICIKEKKKAGEGANMDTTTPTRKKAGNEKTQKNVDRAQRYIDKNPNCSIREVSEITGFPLQTIYTWKRRKFIDWTSNTEIKKELGKTGKDDHKTRALMKKVKKELAERQKERNKPKEPTTSALQELGAVKQAVESKPLKGSKKPASGPLDAEKIAELLEMGKKLSISEIRSLIKQRLITHIDDAKSVSNYAAALKAMAGVQDVELEDVYVNENLVKVYVPEEIPEPKEVLEVEAIEY